MLSDSDNRYLHLVRQDCPLPPGTHVVAYCRDSGGDEQDRSVGQQADTIREYCLHHNLVLDQVYLDEARLSSNTDKREALQEMLLDLRRQFKRINDRYKRERLVKERPFGVVFWKSNRLGRDSIEATNIKTDLRLRGITIIDLVTSANTGNAAMDALIEAFQSWQDEQLLDEISDNAKRGLADLVSKRDDDPEFLKYNPGWKSTGGYIGLTPAPPPMGFKRESLQIGIFHRKKGRAAGTPRIMNRLVPDPATWDRCYLAWKMRHEGSQIGDIHKATKLFKNTNGYTTFFDNRIYIGEYEYGGKTYVDFVPAMIPKEWFDLEQERRAERAHKVAGEKVRPEYEPRRVSSEHLLSGLVFCGFVEGEEHPMHVETIPAEKGKHGSYVHFICTTKKNSRNAGCQAGRISAKALDQAVIDNLLEHVLTLETLQPIADGIAAQLSERSRDAGTRIAAVQSKLDEARKSLDNLVDAIEKMGYAPHLQERYDKRKREEAELLSELTRLKALTVKPAQLQYVSQDMLKQWLLHTRATLESGDRALARRAIQQFVAKIVVKNGTGTLYYTFPLDDVDMSSVRSVDLKGFEPFTSTVRL